MIHVTGRRPFVVAVLVKTDNTGLLLRYGVDDVPLPVSDRRHVQVVNPAEWPAQLRRDPARVLADIYRAGAVDYSGLQTLAVHLEKEAWAGNSLVPVKRPLLTRMLIDEAKAALKAEAGLKAVRAQEERDGLGLRPSEEVSPPDFLERPNAKGADNSLPPEEAADAEEEDDAEVASAVPAPTKKKSLKSPTKGVKAGPWLREFILHVAEDGGEKASDQWWALQTASRKGWLKVSAYAPILREILLQAAGSVDSTKGRKEEVNRLAAAVRREIAAIGRPQSEVLRVCLITADSAAIEFATLADWSWSQINDRPDIDNQVVLNEAVASAPRWTLKTLWLTLRPTLASLPLGVDFPPGLANARYQFLLSLLLDEQRGQGYYLPRFSEVVSREADKEATASALLCLLSDGIVPSASAMNIAEQVTASPQLRVPFLNALCREETWLDAVFEATLRAHGVQPADWLSWAAAPGVKLSKANILARIIQQSLPKLSDALKVGGEFEGGLGSSWTCAGLLAFLDANASASLGSEDQAAFGGAVSLWDHFLRTKALPSLSQAQKGIVSEIEARLGAETLAATEETGRIRSEAEAFRQEVKRLSGMDRTANNPLAATAGWAQDLISLIDDLDRQFLQSPAQSGTLGRTIKLLLMTLKKHSVTALDVVPGDVIARSRWQSAAGEFKVFEDSVEAEMLTVVQRGFVLEESSGRREVLRPALLDQLFS